VKSKPQPDDTLRATLPYKSEETTPFPLCKAAPHSRQRGRVGQFSCGQPRVGTAAKTLPLWTCALASRVRAPVVSLSVDGPTVWEARLSGGVVELSAAELREYAAAGAMAPDTLIRCAELPAWTPLSALQSMITPFQDGSRSTDNSRARLASLLADRLPGPGDLLDGTFEIVREVGHGSMGRVYLANDLDLDRPVAVKVLEPSCAARPGMVEMFLHEAKVAARIRNPHVVRVHGRGALPGGLPYIVMEFLHGEDLAQLLPYRGVGIEAAIGIAVELCEGLAPVHANGIVHCDLKPQNIFRLDSAGGKSTIVIVDFGIAALSRAMSRRPSRPPEGEGRFLGSPAYMAPEQFDLGGEVDNRTDIWALGVVLYELATGGIPFGGGQSGQLSVLLDAIRGEPYRPLPLEASCLDAVLSRCLEKNPEQRYANVESLAADLRGIV
jgi:Protein kinase domain